MPIKWFNKKKALVVEDNENPRRIIARHLKEQNYNVIEASNGLEALEAVSNYEFEIIITDLLMPGLSGVEFIKRYKNNNKESKTRIIIATGAGKPKALEKLQEKWPDVMILEKPFLISQFLEIITGNDVSTLKGDIVVDDN